MVEPEILFIGFGLNYFIENKVQSEAILHTFLKVKKKKRKTVKFVYIRETLLVLL